MNVELDWHELRLAGEVGVVRRVASLARGITDGFPGPEPWTREIDGACAELAVAKHLNVYWGAGVDTFKAPDVGPFHVRHTVRADGCLIVRERDPVDAVYVLVTGEPPRFTICGAIQGHDAKRPEWLRDPGGNGAAYFVPQMALGVLV